ncbi:MAG: hypothetical protein RLZZ15_3938 [Verrucomicrobiota bacterium]|jgi:hypothetical protein
MNDVPPVAATIAFAEILLARADPAFLGRAFCAGTVRKHGANEQ